MEGGSYTVTVFAPLRLAHRETISPAQLGRAYCTEVAEQVPYWVAVLTPAERPLLDDRCTPMRDSRVGQTSVTFRVPAVSSRYRVPLLAALGSAVHTWQRGLCRGSSSGVLVDLNFDGTGAVHPVRLPAVAVDTLEDSHHRSHVLDGTAHRLDSVPNKGRDYSLARSYPALASRNGAQILVRDDAGEPQRSDYALDIAFTESGPNTVLARVTWFCELEGIEALMRNWSAAFLHLTFDAV